jgi:divalent metal cation (Fe/Co/Zn/Cd) transporter
MLQNESFIFQIYGFFLQWKWLRLLYKNNLKELNLFSVTDKRNQEKRLIRVYMGILFISLLLTIVMPRKKIRSKIITNSNAKEKNSIKNNWKSK